MIFPVPHRFFGSGAWSERGWLAVWGGNGAGRCCGWLKMVGELGNYFGIFGGLSWNFRLFSFNDIRAIRVLRGATEIYPISPRMQPSLTRGTW